MARNNKCSSETEQFVLHLWDLAPEEWLTPENRASHRITNAKIVGDPGNEEIVVEVERYRETEIEQFECPNCGNEQTEETLEKWGGCELCGTEVRSKDTETNL